MKVIELAGNHNSLEDFLEMARQETIILRKANSQDSVLATIDDFDLELEVLRNNKEFMAYLDTLSEEKATIPIEDVEKELGFK